VTSTESSPLAKTVGELRRREFHELRATIRERGSARAFVTCITFVSWAVTVLLVGRMTVSFVSAVVPLIVLIAGFEVMFALHVGAERIGRYLFVFYESIPEAPKWETAIAAFGQTSAAAMPHLSALAHTTFVAATLVNLAAAVVSAAQLRPEAYTEPGTVILGLLHALFVGRIYQAMRQARGQRERDTAAFLEISKRLSSGPKSK
jgi:hypothetical protein